MLTLYLAATLTSGALIGLSQFLGGHGHHGAEHGGDGHGGADGDHDAQGHGHGLADSVGQVLPLASLSFWTYFLGAFGLSGLLLTWLGSPLSWGVAPVASAVGYVAGLFSTQLVRRLRRSETDSSVRAGELVGTVARVLLPVGKEHPGKVRVQVKGKLVDLIASSDDDPPLGPGRTVVVHEVQDDGAVKVV